MSVAVMSRIRLVGLNTERGKIMDALVKNKFYEAKKAEKVCGLESERDTSRMNALKAKQARISFAIDFFGANRAELTRLAEKNENLNLDVPTKLKPLKKNGRKIITEEDFKDVAAKEYELLGVCDALTELSKDLTELKAKINRNRAELKGYMQYKAMDCKFSLLGEYEYVNIYAAFNPSRVPKLDGVFDGLTAAHGLISAEGSLLIFAVTKSDAPELVRRVTERGFSLCAYRDDVTASEKIDALNEEYKNLIELSAKKRVSALSYESKFDELKTLYDVFELDVERAEAEEGFLNTSEAFVLEGWVPEKRKDEVRRDVESVANVYLEFLRPKEGDTPPTLTENVKIVKPFEDVTNMYSVPKYRELDPNAIMSIFFFIFFGIMIGDAGYGMILTAAGLILALKGKLEKGTKSLLLMIGICGVSAVVWGILFGGYFAIDFGNKQVALWFNPLENPINLLILSIVCGCAQLFAGYLIKAIKLIKDKKPFSAMFDAGFILVLFVAIALLGFYILFGGQNLLYAAIGLAGFSVLGILLTAGREKKNIAGKILGGVSGLYGLVNLFSDVLSYCRLFGLSLASCAIGFAFNTLGGMFFSLGGFGYVIGVIILIPLHVFNIGIGVLGAYVHNARLQFLEFYGKFYEGEGRAFKPLGERTKYIRFE